MEENKKETEKKPTPKKKEEIKPVEDEEILEDETELEKQVKAALNQKIDLNASPLERFARLKVAIRGVLLRKSIAGYNSRYFYIPLKHLQAAFTRLELAFGLTSVYDLERTEINGRFFYDATRTLYDLKTNQHIIKTKIDVTDLHLNQNLPNQEHVLEYMQEVFAIEIPKDAWEMAFLNYFDPQKKGANSTYFQRYTYMQLYDFQEVDYDDIEEKPQGKDKTTTKKTTKSGIKTAKQKRLDNEDALKLREEIRKTYGRDTIVKNLPQDKKFSTMNYEELLDFKNKLEKEEKENGTTDTE